MKRKNRRSILQNHAITRWRGAAIGTSLLAKTSGNRAQLIILCLDYGRGHGQNLVVSKKVLFGVMLGS